MICKNNETILKVKLRQNGPLLLSGNVVGSSKQRHITIFLFHSGGGDVGGALNFTNKSLNRRATWIYFYGHNGQYARMNGYIFYTLVIQ